MCLGSLPSALGAEECPGLLSAVVGTQREHGDGPLAEPARNQPCVESRQCLLPLRTEDNHQSSCGISEQKSMMWRERICRHLKKVV